MFPANITATDVFRELSSEHLWQVAGLLLGAWGVAKAVRWFIRHAAERAPARFRLPLLRLLPLSRLLVGIVAAVVIAPILIEPNFRNVVAVLVATSVALAFVFKDYASGLVAGVTAVLENAYQPGDWIEFDGAYGEVKSIGLRAVRIVTPDDTEVWIPHARLWQASVFNATSGNRGLLCVADFYLDPDHDADAVRGVLTGVAQNSAYRQPGTAVTVIVLEKPWGTHYRLKAYVKESREQFLFITDLTIRGKEAIRSLGVRFAQAAYAEMKH